MPYQEVIIKQFAWHIEKRVQNWDEAAVAPTDAAATWAKLTNYRLDVAQRWWDAGISPTALAQVVELITEGLNPADLALRVQGRTIAEHLARGSSVRWCLMAAGWAKPAVAAPRRHKRRPVNGK